MMWGLVFKCFCEVGQNRLSDGLDAAGGTIMETKRQISIMLNTNILTFCKNHFVAQRTSKLVKFQLTSKNQKRFMITFHETKKNND